uniref:Uncharacterized protein n=1 Tax=Schlesneria paludicola TaxID=360056 RepID=A0A7C2JYN0_9PLAN
MQRGGHHHTASLAPARRGDATKTVLIVIAVLGGAMMLSCVGLGVAGYFWFQRNFGNVAVSDPVKIRQITAELADITIPPEFQPQGASQVFGMNVVNYQWCPAGNCPSWEDMDEDSDFSDWNTGSLTLTTFAADGPVDVDENEFWEEQFSEANLKERFRSYTRDVQEFTIGGKTCKFFIVKGEEIVWNDLDEDMEQAGDGLAETTPPAATETPAAATEPEAASTEPPAAAPDVAAQPAAPVKPGRQIVWVEGVFPGKKGSCTLNLYLEAGDCDEGKILGMLQSIR